MRYCVVKNTIKVIDGSNNPVEIMLQNAINAGFSESEVEILSEEEYLARKALEPIPPQPPSEIEQLRIEQAKANAELVDLILLIGGMK